MRSASLNISLPRSGRRDLAPGALHRRIGGAHGAVDILGAGARDLGDRLLGRGIDRREVRARARRDPLVVDEELVFQESFSITDECTASCEFKSQIVTPAKAGVHRHGPLEYGPGFRRGDN